MGFTATMDDHGDTLLAAPVVDQAALHGLLKRGRDGGMPLVSVIRVKTSHKQASDDKQ